MRGKQANMCLFYLFCNWIEWIGWWPFEKSIGLGVWSDVWNEMVEWNGIGVCWLVD